MRAWKKQFHGRTGRREYGRDALLFLAAFAIGFQNWIAGYFHLAETSWAQNVFFVWILPILYLVLLPLVAAKLWLNTVSRLHDLGQSGKRGWLLLVPGYNLYLLGVLFLKKGAEGPNAWGEHKQAKKWEIVLDIMLVAIFVFNAVIVYLR